MRKHKHSRLSAEAVAVALAAAGLMSPLTSLGQEADDGDRGSGVDRSAIEEIVVTATKRAASLQDVPMSISALGGDEIARRGLDEMDDYLRAVPGTAFIDRGAGLSEIVIRGISTDAEFGAASTGPAAAVYFADVPITGLSNFGSSLDVKLVDMERVEVLRGPQGTLYGSSSLSGTVRNIPNAPNPDEFTARFATQYSNTGKHGGDNSMFEGMLNIPLVEDKLAIRAVGYHFNDSGYYDNHAGSDPAFSTEAASFGTSDLAIDQEEVGEKTTSGGRFIVLWEPTNELDVSLTYIQQKMDQDGSPQEWLPVGPYLQTNYQIADVLGGGSERLTVDFDISNLVIEYDLGWGSLLSSTSYTTVNSEHLYDGVGRALRGAPYPIQDLNDTEALAEELRLASTLDGPAQFIAGLYYEKSDTHRRQTAHFAGADPALNPFPNPDPLGDPSLLLREDPIVDREQIAAYGELSYELTKSLVATAGIRHFEYERRDRYTSSGAFGGSPRDLEGSDSDQTYRLNVSYSPNEHNMFYAQFAQGFRLGRTVGAHPPVCDLDNDGLIDGTDVSSGQEFLPSDTIDSFELGGKVDLLSDERFRVNLAVFQNDWKNIPVTLVPPCNFVRFVSQGEASVEGIEVETQLRINDGLLLMLGGSHVNTELKGDSSLGSDGDRLPGSPEYNFNGRLHYRFQVANRDAFAQFEYLYVGGFYSDFAQATTEAGGYGQLDLRAGIALSENWDVQLFVNNVNDSDGLTYVDHVDLLAYRLRPRTIGIKFGFAYQ